MKIAYYILLNFFQLIFIVSLTLGYKNNFDLFYVCYKNNLYIKWTKGKKKQSEKTLLINLRSIYKF
jgi:hypothetical protein